MKYGLFLLTILALTIPAEAARRKTRDASGNVLIERGRIRELSRRATTFNGTIRYGRAYGGGPRGFSSAGQAVQAPVDAPVPPVE